MTIGKLAQLKKKVDYFICNQATNIVDIRFHNRYRSNVSNFVLPMIHLIYLLVKTLFTKLQAICIEKPTFVIIDAI